MQIGLSLHAHAIRPAQWHTFILELGRTTDETAHRQGGRASEGAARGGAHALGLTTLRRILRTVKRMVGPPRRATHAAAAEAGPACARPTPAHEAPAAQPAYWLAQRAAPAGLASRPRTAPRAPPAVGQRLLDARCMLLLLPPRGTHASGDGLRGPVKNAMGPSLFYRNYAFGPPRGL